MSHLAKNHSPDSPHLLFSPQPESRRQARSGAFGGFAGTSSDFTKVLLGSLRGLFGLLECFFDDWILQCQTFRGGQRLLQGEVAILGLQAGAGLSVRGDVVQDLVVVEVGKLGSVFEVIGCADGDGDFEAFDFGFVDQCSFALQE